MLAEYKKYIIEQAEEMAEELIACGCVGEEKRQSIIDKYTKTHFEKLENIMQNGLNCGGIMKAVAKVDGITKRGERYYFIVGKQLFDCNYKLAQ